MFAQHAFRPVLTALLVSLAPFGAGVSAETAPLAVDSARVTIAGSSNIHEYTATTTTVRVTRVSVAPTVSAATFWDDIVKPGALQGFEVVIPAATLSSPKAGLDKNMHKALDVEKHPDITFRLVRFEPAAAGSLKAIGVLRIAGTEREVALDLKLERRGATLAVKGQLALLMTDYGIKPPVAMLGMLKTDPKVTITVETVLSVPRT